MLLTTLIVQISGRALREPTTRMDAVLYAPAEHQQQNPSASLQYGDLYASMGDHGIEHHRHKREAYDPYDVYYFYPSYSQTRPVYYEPTYINRRDTEDNRITEKGQKYKYTPLFQYKATQSRRRKLFVPNLFG